MDIKFYTSLVLKVHCFCRSSVTIALSASALAHLLPLPAISQPRLAANLSSPPQTERLPDLDGSVVAKAQTDPVQLAAGAGVPRRPHLLLLPWHVQRPLRNGRRGAGRPRRCQQRQHRPLHHFRPLRSPRRWDLQRARPPPHPLRRVHHLRPLRRLFPLLQPLPPPDLRRRRRCRARRWSRIALGRPGCYHDVLSTRTSQGGNDNPQGSYISLFWTIFNMGGVVGGLIPFVLNYHRTSAASVNDGTYIAFMCFMSTGAVLSFAILPPHKVVREDGSRAAKARYSSTATEAVEILRLFLNWRMLLVAPAAWASNFFYTYQFNNVNGLLFNLRTSGLNNAFYWGAQMLGSVGIGWVLDFSLRSRRERGLLGVLVVAVVGTVVWGGGLANQLRYPGGKWENKIDFRDSGGRYAGPFLLYFSYGLLDAMFQSLVYWVIGALAHDSETLSRYSGFYKGVQSAGAAVAWQVDKNKTPLISQLVVSWCLTTMSYPLLAVLVALAVDVQGDSENRQQPAEAMAVAISPI